MNFLSNVGSLNFTSISSFSDKNGREHRNNHSSKIGNSVDFDVVELSSKHNKTKQNNKSRAYWKYFSDCVTYRDLAKRELELMDREGYNPEDTHMTFDTISRLFMEPEEYYRELDSLQGGPRLRVIDGTYEAESNTDGVNKDNNSLKIFKPKEPEQISDDYADCDSDCNTDLEEGYKIKPESMLASKTAVISNEEDFFIDCDSDSDADI